MRCFVFRVCWSDVFNFSFPRSKAHGFFAIRIRFFFCVALSLLPILLSLISLNTNVVFSISKYDFSFVFVFVHFAQIHFKWIYTEIHSVFMLLSFCLIYALSFGLALAKYKSPSFILFCLKRTSKLKGKKKLRQQNSFAKVLQTDESHWITSARITFFNETRYYEMDKVNISRK